MTTSLPHHERLFCWMLLKYFQSFSPFRRATLEASANADVTNTQGLAMSTDMLFLEHSKNGAVAIGMFKTKAVLFRDLQIILPVIFNNYTKAFVN